MTDGHSPSRQGVVQYDKMMERDTKAPSSRHEPDLFEITFETIPDGVIITLAEDGSIVNANEGFQQLSGYSKEEIVGHRTVDFHLWENVDERARLLSDLSRRGSVDDFVAQLRRKDGSIVAVLMHAVYFTHASDRCILAVCKDLDQWTSLGRNLDNTRARYSDLVELLPAVLFECDEQLRITFLNAAGLRLVGKPLDAASKPFLSDLVTPLVKVDLLQRAMEAKESSLQSRIEVDVRTAEGQSYRALLTISPIRGRETASAYLGVLVDITDEQLVRNRLSRLSQAVEQSPSLVLITDKAGHIEYVNPRFTLLTGYTLEEAIGRTPRILRSGTVSEETYRTMWNTILAGKEWKTEIINRKKNGETYWQRSTISPIYDERNNLTHFLEVAEDITREKELENALFQSQKMEAIGHLAGGIAHDFNNMLTVIIGLGELMQGRLEKNDQLYGYTESILSAARKSASLTQQLLAFSRKQLLNPEALDMNVVIKDAEKLLLRIVGDNIRIRTELHPDLGLALLDQSQVHQIILNLVVNAREAISGSGTVTVSTDRFDCGEEKVVASGKLSVGSYVVLSVADTGCGMDAQVLSRIFEPFYTTKSSGTGLGLATVYGIVQQSNGQIHVQSTPRSGSIFTVYFPLAQPRVKGRSGGPRESGGSQGSETILVVEDDEAVRTFVAGVLAGHGYTVVPAESAERAKQIWTETKERIDLLLTDVVLPQEDGVHLYGSLRRQRPNLPVVYMSGYTEDSASMLLELADGRMLLPKPFGADQLSKAVRQVLDGDVDVRRRGEGRSPANAD